MIEILDAKNRKLAGSTFPAKEGLVFNKVYYSEEEIKEAVIN